MLLQFVYPVREHDDGSVTVGVQIEDYTGMVRGTVDHALDIQVTFPDRKSFKDWVVKYGISYVPRVLVPRDMRFGHNIKVGSS